MHVQPRASRSQVHGIHGSALRIRVQAPPADGRANEAVVRTLAAALGLATRDVQLVAGLKGREKRVRVFGDPSTLERAVRRLSELGSAV